MPNPEPPNLVGDVIVDGDEIGDGGRDGIGIGGIGRGRGRGRGQRRGQG